MQNKIISVPPKILITGGNGNIAQMIQRHLGNKYDITNASRNELNLLKYPDMVTFFATNSFDIVIHTAILGGRRTKPETGETSYINMLMFENLMRFYDKFKMIINLDSGAIYDRSTDIYCRKEVDIFTVPTDYYGFSKYAIYQRAFERHKVINFRIFNVFHKNEEPDRFIASCFRADKTGEKLTIFEDKYFDFIYEDDFIKIVDYYIQNLDQIHGTLFKNINIGYKKKYRLSDIARLIMKNHDLIDVQNSEMKHNYCGDCTKLYQLPIDFDGLPESLVKYAST
jgi:nucleoside-diphosphate-sugar epimerase